MNICVCMIFSYIHTHKVYIDMNKKQSNSFSINYLSIWAALLSIVLISYFLILFSKSVLSNNASFQ